MNFQFQISLQWQCCNIEHNKPQPKTNTHTETEEKKIQNKQDKQATNKKHTTFNTTYCEQFQISSFHFSFCTFDCLCLFVVMSKHRVWSTIVDPLVSKSLYVHHETSASYITLTIPIIIISCFIIHSILTKILHNKLININNQKQTTKQNDNNNSRKEKEDENKQQDNEAHQTNQIADEKLIRQQSAIIANRSNYYRKHVITVCLIQ